MRLKARKKPILMFPAKHGRESVRISTRSNLMATRATYQFNSKNPEVTTTVYIHYDGYPQGAAYYFYQTLLNPSSGNLATQFIKANNQAEITKSHEAHGDTEWQYTIDGDNLEATVSVFHVSEEERLPMFRFALPLYQFINNYISDKSVDKIVPVELNYRKILLNKELAIKELEKNRFTKEDKDIIRNAFNLEESTTPV